MKTTTALAVALLALVVAACGGASDEVGGRATPRRPPERRRRDDEALARRLRRAEGRLRQGHPGSSTRRRQGKGITFSQSYGASGDQSRKVESGLPTDVVNFCVEPDVTRLVKSGLVDDELEPERAQGHPVRLGRHDRDPQGQPEEHHRPGTTCSSRASRSSRRTRSARAARSGTCSRPTPRRATAAQDPKAGLAYLSKLIGDHIKVQPKSGREATETFLQGTGDVLLSYENEALFAERSGEDVEHHTPRHVQDREPGRGRSTRPSTTSRRRRSSTSCTRPRARRRGPRPASARSTRPSRRSSPPTSRSRRSSGRSTTSAAGARSTTSSSTRTTAPWPRSTTRRRASPMAARRAPARRAGKAHAPAAASGPSGSASPRCG